MYCGCYFGVISVAWLCMCLCLCLFCLTGWNILKLEAVFTTRQLLFITGALQVEWLDSTCVGLLTFLTATSPFEFQNWWHIDDSKGTSPQLPFPGIRRFVKYYNWPDHHWPRNERSCHIMSLWEAISIDSVVASKWSWQKGESWGCWDAWVSYAKFQDQWIECEMMWNAMNIRIEAWCSLGCEEVLIKGDFQLGSALPADLENFEQLVWTPKFPHQFHDVCF